jgi:nicotinamidase-related amidase
MSSPGELLVVVDMQELFRDASSPWLVPGFDELTDPIGRLVRTFGERVVHTRFTLPVSIEGSWRRYYETFDAVTRPENAGWFELAEPYRSWAGEVIERSIFNAWGELRGMAGDTPKIVLCGVATDCCVISTALPAADAGASIRVVEDACRGSSARAHGAAISVLAGYAPQITITTVDAEIELAGAAQLSP